MLSKNARPDGAEQNNTVIGCLQLTLIPGLTRQGAWRALVESVRVASHLRAQGIGKAFMRHAIVCAREKGAKLMQLTSDMRRSEALRFYKALGFSQSHAGFKLEL
ncbi:MAG: GNAT family N-acetyltransferase [Rhodospirillaceae bacterium]|nr:GNAT family N-acetyltransferase [Rhodospirillaceae bacterium]